MERKWLIIGISGVTCGGKTTLAKEIKNTLPNIKVISQDNYFLPKDSPKHVYIPELNHFNWELLSSLDMQKMYNDIKMLISDRIITTELRDVMKECHGKHIKKIVVEEPLTNDEIVSIRKTLNEFEVHLLLIEGFSIFNYPPIEELCDMKFYLTLKYEVCYERRKRRVYDPPDVPGYFEKCVWPEHCRQLQEIRKKCTNIIYLSEKDKDKCTIVLKHLLNFSKIFSSKQC